MIGQSAALQEHLAGPCLTMCTCWRVERRDGIVFGFTDHPVDLTVDGIRYGAATGFTPTDMERSAGGGAGNLDVEIVLDATAMTEADIIAGKYNGASFAVLSVNYESLEYWVEMAGDLGEVKLEGGHYSVELRGAKYRLQNPIVESYSKTCRAQLGDSRCRVNRDLYAATGAVTAVAANRVFTDMARTETAENWRYGTVEWLTGDNAGASGEVAHSTAVGVITLFEAPPNPITIGDTYRIYTGCDKQLDTCVDRYDNLLNFRGEPFIPGLDQITKGPAR